MSFTRFIFSSILVCVLFSSNHQFNNPFIEVSKKANPCIVSIISEKEVVQKQFNPFFNDPFFEDFFPEFKRKGESLGSGVIIDNEGYIITNNHVIKGADDIYIKVNGDKDYKASIIGADPLSDIAVLKIDTEDKFIPVNFGNSDKARIGDWVIAIGNPFGLGGTVTAGIVSARNRSIGLSRYEDYIQTDASINQGNSGGPVSYTHLTLPTNREV